MSLPQAPQWGEPRSAGRILFFLPHSAQVSIDTGPAGAALPVVVLGSVIVMLVTGLGLHYFEPLPDWMRTGVTFVHDLLAAVVVVLSGTVGNNLDKWGVLIAGGAALALIVRRWLPAGLDRWILAIPLAGLAGLSIYSLFEFIVPHLKL